MRTQFSKLALTAGLMLAITFTFSCSSPDDNNGGGGGSGGNNNGNGGSNTPSAGPCPNATTSNGSMSCGGQTYGTVQIGEQVWMAKNLNYNVSGSRCYGNAESDCNKYGRLYDWETARVVCPSGWHLPSDSDWGELVSHVESDNGCSSCAAQHLKSKSGWSQSGNGIDTYGFSALPGGKGSPNGGFIDAGNYGYWWTATEVSADYAYCKGMLYWIEYVIVEYRGTMVGSCNGGKTYLNSVRCVQD